MQPPSPQDIAITALFIVRPSIAALCRGKRERLAIQDDVSIQVAKAAIQLEREGHSIPSLDNICQEQYALDQARVQAWIDRQQAEQLALEQEILMGLGL